MRNPGKAQFFGPLDTFVEEMEVGTADVDQGENGEGRKSEKDGLYDDQSEGGV